MNYNFNGTITQNGQPISGGGGVYLYKARLRDTYMSPIGVVVLYKSTIEKITKKSDLAAIINQVATGYTDGIPCSLGLNVSNNVLRTEPRLFANTATNLLIGYKPVTFSADGSSVTVTTSSQDSISVADLGEVVVIEM